MDDDKKDTIGGTLVPRGKPLQSGSRIVGMGSVVATRAEAAGEGSVSATYIAVSSVAPQIEQPSILAAEAMFAKLSDAELYVYANDELPIGPRMGLTSMAESTLKALANHDVLKRQLKLAEAKAEKDRRWRLYEILITAAVSGVVGIVIGRLTGN